MVCEVFNFRKHIRALLSLILFSSFLFVVSIVFDSLPIFVFHILRHFVDN